MNKISILTLGVFLCLTAQTTHSESLEKSYQRVSSAVVGPSGKIVPARFAAVRAAERAATLATLAATQNAAVSAQQLDAWMSPIIGPHVLKNGDPECRLFSVVKEAVPDTNPGTKGNSLYSVNAGTNHYDNFIPLYDESERTLKNGSLKLTDSTLTYFYVWKQGINKDQYRHEVTLNEDAQGNLVGATLKSSVKPGGLFSGTKLGDLLPGWQTVFEIACQ